MPPDPDCLSDEERVWSLSLCSECGCLTENLDECPTCPDGSLTDIEVIPSQDRDRLREKARLALSVLLDPALDRHDYSGWSSVERARKLLSDALSRNPNPEEER